jgi:hypothetical protein
MATSALAPISRQNETGQIPGFWKFSNAVGTGSQLGIILVGRVIVGHLGATLVDLCQRGFPRIDDIPGGDDAQWLLTDQRSQAPGPAVPLLPFETVMLDGLFGSQVQVRLPEAGAGLLAVIDRVRAELRRDAVRHGWLRRWRQDRRTEHGEQLLRQIQGFRQALRGRVLSGAGVPAALAPYMMIFGLAAAPGVDARTRDDAASQRSGEIPWARLDVFAVAWSAWVNESCGRDAHGRSDDFAHQWHVPAGHDHGNPAHHSGYHGYGGGGHGGFGGGHGHGGPILARVCDTFVGVPHLGWL